MNRQSKPCWIHSSHDLVCACLCVCVCVCMFT
uniref:Uncharacterized protein n=1 Tax=Anguilla anguilla TaxID=7936 RepID=A0A0E9UUQ1_ANGAN